MAQLYYLEDVVYIQNDSVGSRLKGLTIEDTVNLRIVPAGNAKVPEFLGVTEMKSEPLFTEHDSWR